MFDIDLQSRTPIYEQLYKWVVELVMTHRLSRGDKLPSVRDIAKQLGINPNTVSKAFGLLERDGVICTVPGKGSFVSDKNKDIVVNKAKEKFSAAVAEALSVGISPEELKKIISDTANTEKNKGEVKSDDQT
ncbi:MAG: GntR family transcriptional regulator [Oscillospiraceae bacterium]|nr:GntR family transcriptional regulator [Oscillospiraceae bacterium]